MDRLCVSAGGLAHTLRRAPRRREQRDVTTEGRLGGDDRVEDRRFTDARTAGDDADRRAQREAHGGALLFAQDDGAAGAGGFVLYRRRQQASHNRDRDFGLQIPKFGAYEGMLDSDDGLTL